MKKILLAVLINVFMTSPLWANVTLEQSFPKNGAMFMQSPNKVQLKFAKMVNLKSIRLFDAAGNMSVLAVGDGRHKKFFSAPLMTLNKGNYRVAWSVEGHDGDAKNGTFDFMIHCFLEVIIEGSLGSLLYFLKADKY